VGRAVADEHLIVELKASGARPPFWLLHPLGGTLLFAARFVKHLDKEQPLLGIEARGVNGKALPFASIPEAAQHYLSLLLERQPRGPYFLGGPSFGGNLAYEMARLLAQRGREVAMLALFDAHGPGFPRPVAFPRRVLNHLEKLRSLDFTGQRAAKSVYQEARIPEGEGGTLEHLRRVTLAHHQALQSYRPLSYHGKVLLFRARTPPHWPGMRFDDPTNGFGRIVRGSLEVISVPGTHQLILDPPWVDTLAAEFSRALTRVQLSPEASASAAE
jgi:thioesterase domain-containing protein